MDQKEVSDRIVAKYNTKNYGRLSILSNWRMEIERILDVDPKSFKPSPKIKSTLLVLIPKKKYHNIQDPRKLEHITNIFFNQKRKMIKMKINFIFFLNSTMLIMLQLIKFF